MPVEITTVSLACGRTATGTMEATHLPSAHRWGFALLTRPLGRRMTAWGLTGHSRNVREAGYVMDRPIERHALLRHRRLLNRLPADQGHVGADATYCLNTFSR